jgi:hypothetical protein
MASAVKERANEKIEIVDLPEEPKKRGIKLWLAIPLVLAIVVGVSMVIRRFFAPGDEE